MAEEIDIMRRPYISEEWLNRQQLVRFEVTINLRSRRQKREGSAVQPLGRRKTRKRLLGVFIV